MASTFVSKSRRVRFELTLRIVDLNNVPLVTGSSFIKWHLPSSNAAEHRGRTNKCAIRDHRVRYDYEKQTAIRLTVGKDGMLQECPIHFEVQQEYSSGGRGERIKLGDVHLNLSEYVDTALDQPASPGHGGGGGGGGGTGGDAAAASAATDANEGITRRYLMQESKINSTLKIGIHMRHVEGTRDYYAPALRTAPVFGGIAGIISSSEPTGTPHLGPDNAESTQESIPPSFNVNNREMGEMQDMYRRTLAAFWTSQPGELKADECIEDIFSGGDGWGKGGRPGVSNEQSQPGSGASTPNAHHHHHHHYDGMSRDTTAASKHGGDAVRSMMHGHGHGHKRNFEGSRRLDKGFKKVPGELEEMDVRDNLVSWSIGEKSYS